MCSVAMHNAGKPRVTLTQLYKCFCSCFCCLASSTGSIPYCNPRECDAPSSCKCFKGGKPPENVLFEDSHALAQIFPSSPSSFPAPQKTCCSIMNFLHH